MKMLTRNIFEKARRTAAGAYLFGIVVLLAHAAWGAPTVNGLFYGDGDASDYVLYNTSIGGSKLWYTVVSNRLYVALVVDRSVNDNVFGDRTYTQNAGWGPPHPAHRLVDSEFAEFTLTVGSVSYQWQQGYGEEINGVWISDHTTGAGSGTPPPDYVSSSSFAWNINNYVANPSPNWNMYANGATINDWKSPFESSAPSVVLGLDGYPATGTIGYSPYYQWEWPMVYEWSVDLSGFGSDPIFVISGSSHHSPAKSGNENDTFDDPPGNGFLSDYGDLPSPYPTLLADDGPYHYIVPNGVSLGMGADPEPDGNPDAAALGDDNLGLDDEDGVALNYVDPGVELVFDLTISAPGYLSAFFDFTESGTLSAATLLSSTGPAALSPGAITDLYLPAAGTYKLYIAVPSSVASKIAARFRVTNEAGQGGALPTGGALSGEVEDYLWNTATFLSTEINLKVYAVGNGGVMIEIATVNENGNSDIEIYALFDGGWVLVANVPAEDVVGFGSNLYAVEAFGLTPGASYLFRIVDESGNIFELDAPLTVALSPVTVASITLTPELTEVSFNTEYGNFYQVLVATTLGAHAEWKLEYVSSPTARGWSALSIDPFMAGPFESTAVRIPRKHDRAFFKIVKIE